MTADSVSSVFGIREKGSAVEFRLLGSLEVTSNGRSVDLGPLKQRSLLALLLIHANEVVSTDRILEELWDGQAKENALWVYVSRLRSALEPDRKDRGESSLLLRKDRGYVLSVDPSLIDSNRFAGLVSDGRSLLSTDADAAAETLAQALQMWRGSPLQDFTYEAFARGEIARLEELRLEAIESRIDADLKRDVEVSAIELEALVRDHPLREHLTAQLMTVLYRNGRQAEALRAFQKTRQHLVDELGIEPSHDLRRLEEQILLQDPSLRPEKPAQPAIEGPNPFKGLRAFEETDAMDFFGRAALVAELVDAMSGRERLVAVVGPSGSGKSSVVRAGLIPALRQGALAGSDGWLTASMLPGGQPFTELETALRRAGLREQLGDGKGEVLKAAVRLLPDDDAKLVLLIDQFEELFTLVDSEAIRKRFIANLVDAISDPRGRVFVVVTLRADLYDRPLLYPELAERLTANQVNVLPLTSEELEAAAIEPAARSGVELSPALVGELIADVTDQPGALPLFQYTLTDLFEARTGSSVTVADYRTIGGLRGALTGRAEQLFGDLSSHEQEAARHLFLRLVSVSERREDSRRRVLASELTALDVDTVALQAVIARFGGHRLLTFDREPATGSPTVEVAHEALLREWVRLRDWIDESREDIARYASFSVAVTEWLEAEREPDFLFTGTRLEQYESWSQQSSVQLTRTDRQFLDAAMERRQLEVEAQEQLQAEQLQLQRRARTRLWGFATAVGILVMAGAVLLVGALTPTPAVGLVFEGREGVGSWMDLVATGFDNAGLEHEFEPVEAVSLVDPEEDFRRLAEAGTELVIGSGVVVASGLKAAAPDYPETRFAILNTRIDLPNVRSLLFASEQGSYLVGAAAALKSETGVIGFIGGFQIPSIQRFQAGFEAGALAINPEIEILATYIDTFLDRLPGQLAATTLYREGADVVFGAAGGGPARGMLQAAFEMSDPAQHLWVIGVDSDLWLVAAEDHHRPHVLTSMINRGDVAIRTAIEDHFQGITEPQVRLFILAEEGVDFSTSGGFVDDIVDELNLLKAQIIDGVIVVPTLPTVEPIPPF